MKSSADDFGKGTYGFDAAFLRQHVKKCIELSDGPAKVMLAADFQGRVMTSTATGDSGLSYGWINYDLIASGETKPQFNPVGGEERFWLGPEGGQFALYFKSHDAFQINNWQVPPAIDTEPFEVVAQTQDNAVFRKHTTLRNYSGTLFSIGITRSITLLSKGELSAAIGVDLPGDVSAVGYETLNEISNTGDADWNQKNGLLSIWLLGMFNPSAETTVFIPFRPASGAAGLVTSDYFGEVPKERLSIRDSVVYFTCDGKYRSKIGLPPGIAKPVAGSFDARNAVLTLIVFPVEKDGLYVNSKWEMQAQPYRGDVVNAYNDGPLADGTQLGPFYELESSSPAKALKAGERMSHRQVTCHITGDDQTLQAIARKVLGADLSISSPP